MSKPSIPKGTRDFSAAEMAKRNYILDTIKKYFRLYGFEQIETPAMENLSTLTGKYGEEGDQLLFKILNSRIHESKEKDKLQEEFTKSLEGARNTPVLTERALRYDLTVPFARYVVQHQHEITFPFKRFQIQPVWRADKPQKGRYREFYQCDADVIGSPSLINEIELIQLMDDVYTKLNIPVAIKINNRKILSGIAEVIGEKEKIVDITVAIDKLDKIGIDGVNKELAENGISSSSIEKIQPLLSFKGNDSEKLNFLKQLLASSEIGLKGISELECVLKAKPQNENSKVELDITLARGLNYYTGAIFEVKAAIGDFIPSITGGGRYDDLTGIFGLPNVSGVGISFGVDRIYDVMEELNLFPAEKLNQQHTQLLLMHMGEAEQQHGLQMLTALRKAGICTELYPDVTKKLNKQFDYATKKDIPYAIVIGSNEVSSKKYTLKTKISKFEDLSLDGIIEQIKNSA
jgi:histidyl-tRNA synthetase